MNTVIVIFDSIMIILLVYFDIMESKENRHLRELYVLLAKATEQLIEQNKELWKLSGTVSKDGKDDSRETDI